EWFLVHLTGRPLPKEGQPLLDPRGFCPLGRETAIQRLEWNNDWPYVVGGNQPSLEIEGPNIEEVKWEKDYDEKGRVLDVTTCDNFTFDQTLKGNEIVIPEDVEYIYLRVDVKTNVYKYSYSFDGTNWEEIPFELYSYKLSDDYIRGGGFFFTGAFVGMQCQVTSGEGKPADFDYFVYKPEEK